MNSEDKFWCWVWTVIGAVTATIAICTTIWATQNPSPGISESLAKKQMMEICVSNNGVYVDGDGDDPICVPIQSRCE